MNGENRIARPEISPEQAQLLSCHYYESLGRLYVVLYDVTHTEV